MTGCERRPEDAFQGYVEGEYVYVASPLAGALQRLAVARGQTVQPGQTLFELEHAAESAGVREATQRVAQSEARLANLKKGLRPSELEALQAQRDRAQANFRLAQIELDRRLKLRQENVIAAAELDTVQTQRDATQAQLAALEAEWVTARLGARPDEIQAATADLAALRAAQAKSQWSLDQKTQAAPTNGWVHDTLYRQGEWVAAGHPVVVLLPPTAIKVRFFVPERELASVRLGQAVAVSFDGADRAYPGTVNYISTQAEFTPPVIYSQQTRAKLVYMIEAAIPPSDAAHFRPGQPVDVTRPAP